MIPEKVVEVLREMNIRLSHYQESVIKEVVAEILSWMLLLAFGVGLAVGIFLSNLIATRI